MRAERAYRPGTAVVQPARQRWLHQIESALQLVTRQEMSYMDSQPSALHRAAHPRATALVPIAVGSTLALV